MKSYTRKEIIKKAKISTATITQYLKRGIIPKPDMRVFDNDTKTSVKAWSEEPALIVIRVLRSRKKSPNITFYHQNTSNLEEFEKRTNEIFNTFIHANKRAISV